MFYCFVWFTSDALFFNGRNLYLCSTEWSRPYEFQQKQDKIMFQWNTVKCILSFCFVVSLFTMKYDFCWNYDICADIRDWKYIMLRSENIPSLAFSCFKARDATVPPSTFTKSASFAFDYSCKSFDQKEPGKGLCGFCLPSRTCDRSLRRREGGRKTLMCIVR